MPQMKALRTPPPGGGIGGGTARAATAASSSVGGAPGAGPSGLHIAAGASSWEGGGCGGIGGLKFRISPSKATQADLPIYGI
jgi:hypothetical protein